MTTVKTNQAAQKTAHLKETKSKKTTANICMSESFRDLTEAQIERTEGKNLLCQTQQPKNSEEKKPRGTSHWSEHLRARCLD